MKVFVGVGEVELPIEMGVQGIEIMRTSSKRWWIYLGLRMVVEYD